MNNLPEKLSVDDFFNIDDVMEIEVNYVPDKGTVTKITLKDKRTIIVVN